MFLEDIKLFSFLPNHLLLRSTLALKEGSTIFSMKKNLHSQVSFCSFLFESKKRENIWKWRRCAESFQGFDEQSLGRRNQQHQGKLSTTGRRDQLCISQPSTHLFLATTNIDLLIQSLDNLKTIPQTWGYRTVFSLLINETSLSYLSWEIQSAVDGRSFMLIIQNPLNFCFVLFCFAFLFLFVCWLVVLFVCSRLFASF